MRDDAAVHNHCMNPDRNYIYSHGKRHYDALEQQVTIINVVPSPHPPPGAPWVETVVMMLGNHAPDS